MARPRVYDQDLRDRLVEGAARTITEQGSGSLSLRTLASQCNTSTNAVYTLFGGKPGLLEAVRETASASFTTAQQAVPATDDALEDLHQLGRAYRCWALDHPDLYAVMFGGREDVPVDREPHRSVLDEPGIAPLISAVQRLLPEDRQAELGHAVLSLWAGVHGCVALEMGPAAGLPLAKRVAVFEAQMAILGEAWRTSLHPEA